MSPTVYTDILKTARLLALSAAIAIAPALAGAQEETPVAPAASLTAQTPPAPVETVGALSSIPAPDVNARAWVTLDANSAQIIAEENADERVEPASLTKIMAAYVIFQALENDRLALDQKVNISEKAWKTEGSRMFAQVNTQVAVDDLLRGMIIQSGNDATVALAEAVAGSESAFVAMMNEEAQRQGLTNTHFTNSPGLPGPEHYTSARDMAILALNLIQDFPQYLHYYSQKEYTYNNIRQPNRNRLLWADSTVDGLKTGHTSSAGYCLVSTALRDGRRVVSVLIGANSDSARAESSLKLLNWSFQNFDTVKLFDQGEPAAQARVWEGQTETVDLGQARPIWITVPRGKATEIKPVAQYKQPLIAPLSEGAEVGTLTLTLDGKVLREEPLVVMKDVPQASFIGRMYDKARLLLQ